MTQCRTGCPSATGRQLFKIGLKNESISEHLSSRVVMSSQIITQFVFNIVWHKYTNEKYAYSEVVTFFLNLIVHTLGDLILVHGKN